MLAPPLRRLTQAVLADPRDPVPRAVLADWLEEHERPAQAAWFRDTLDRDSRSTRLVEQIEALVPGLPHEWAYRLVAHGPLVRALVVLGQDAPLAPLVCGALAGSPLAEGMGLVDLIWANNPEPWLKAIAALLPQVQALRVHGRAPLTGLSAMPGLRDLVVVASSAAGQPIPLGALDRLVIRLRQPTDTVEILDRLAPAQVRTLIFDVVDTPPEAQQVAPFAARVPIGRVEVRSIRR